MAVLCWMAVTLALILSAGNSLADVNQNELARIVQEIFERFIPEKDLPMFSVAVSVPLDTKTGKYDVNQVTDSPEEVQRALTKSELYTGNMVVAATVLEKKVGNVHAEYQTAEKLSKLYENNENKKGLLVFYVYASPCTDKCTNSDEPGKNILSFIKAMTGWNNYAFVFSKTFKPKSSKVIITDKQRREALERLGDSVGLNNIFRCDIQTQRRMECSSCSANGAVNNYCVSDSSD